MKREEPFAKARSVAAVRIAVCLAVLPSFIQGRPIRLAYGFRTGQSLKYVIERQDSVWLPEARGSFLRIGQRLRVLDADEGVRFSLSLSADSLWLGPDTAEPANGYEKMLFGTESQSRETLLRVDASGSSLSGRMRFSPFLLPLPPEPVEPDDAWNFDVRAPYEKPFSGELRVLGDVQFYEITGEEDGDTLAVLALRLQKENQAAFTVREPFQTFTDRYVTHESGTGVLFFNRTKGRVERGVIQWAGTVSSLESGRPGTYRKKSRISFRLDETPE
jgi:hypothetical protein